jgi:hypothetical protein
LLLECSADRSGFRFGHDEHAGRMGMEAVTGKRHYGAGGWVRRIILQDCPK